MVKLTRAVIRLTAGGLFLALGMQGCEDTASTVHEQLEGGSGDASTATSTAADAGHVACEGGAAECLGDRAQRICAPEGGWVTIPCGTDETCRNGRCSPVKPCTPGEKKCATDGAAKVCDADGSAWVVSICGDGKMCKDGDCVRDLQGAECAPGSSQCLDSTTRLRCLPEGRGFESFDCPAGAPCVGGQCQGPTCNVGDSQCINSFTGAATVRTCVDGTKFSDAPCPAGEGCRTTMVGGFPVAACAPAVSCPFQGDQVCGDPTDPSVDSRTVASQCQFQPSGNLAWVRIDCAAPASCDPTSGTCTATCVAGEKRCAGVAGYQECGADGTWLGVTACNSGSTAGLACRPKKGSTLPDVECVDDICAFISNPGIDGGIAGDTGVCDGVKIRRCDAAGHLSAAEDCAQGACVGTNLVRSGYHLGTCSQECKPGESRCVTDGLPVYVTCSGGLWSSAYQTCGNVCKTAVDSNGLRSALCGDECLPDTTRCDGDKLQTCGSGFSWLPSVACSVGRCTGPTGSALCRADCIPGTTVCVGDAKGASDGISQGTAESAVCTSQGTFSADTTVCPGTQTCRTSRTGVTAGCVECLGPTVTGGNDAGLVDSRCSASGQGYDLCGDGNDWDPTTACSSGFSCFVGKPRACGTCPGGFPSGTCSLSNLQTRFFQGATCGSVGLDTPSLCGETPDCCGGACIDQPGGFAFCAPDSFSPCLGSADVISLGNVAPQSLTGTTLFGDDTLSPGCAFRPGSPDTAFSFAAPHAGTFVFDTYGSSIDTVLYVVDALACNELACNDDDQGGASRVSVDLAGGQRVIVMVEGIGDFNLNVADRSQPGCGNGLVEGQEVCDGNDFAHQTCASATLGVRPNGTLGCAGDCSAISLGACTTFNGSDGGTGGSSGKGGGGP